MKISKLFLSTLVLSGAALVMPAIAADTDVLIPVPVPEEFIAEELPESTIAFAERGAPECGNPITFSDAQLEKLAGLKDNFDLNTAEKKAQLRSFYRQMHELMTEANIDRQKISDLHQRINTLKSDLSNARLAYMMDRAEVLTPEQRKEMHHWMLVRQTGPRGGMGRHGCGPHRYGFMLPAGPPPGVLPRGA